MSEQAGRELDALVARKVMQWTNATLHDGIVGPEAYWCTGGKAMCLVDAFTPSTSIEAAWEVVNKMDTAGWSVSIYRVDKWEVSFETAKAYKAERADTAPLAICLAALKAVGEAL